MRKKVEKSVKKLINIRKNNSKMRTTILQIK